MAALLSKSQVGRNAHLKKRPAAVTCGHPPAQTGPSESSPPEQECSRGVVNQEVPVGQEPWTASSRKAECGCWSPGSHLEPRVPARTCCRLLRPFFLQPPAQPAVLSPPGPPPPALQLGPGHREVQRVPSLTQQAHTEHLLYANMVGHKVDTPMRKRHDELCPHAVQSLG